MHQSVKTKIISTLGPATDTHFKIAKLISAGADTFRFNFSHGDHNTHQEMLEKVLKAQEKAHRQVALLQDLSGPKIRTGDFTTGQRTLKKGTQILLTTCKKIAKSKNAIFINYKNLIDDVKVGDRIFLNDGKQQLKVLKKDGKEILVEVLSGGVIKSRRGVNLPDSALSISSFTSKDRKDVLFAIKNNFDFVALSFVQSAKDVQALRRFLQSHNSTAQIIAKIETPQAVNNFDEILKASDAVMIARGDLAVEIGASKVPLLQKRLIKQANNQGKPAIVATQMLESMIENPVPTRAEVSDIANAILDGADAVMLSAETAVGQYPTEAVRVMSSVAKETEQEMDYSKRINKPNLSSKCPYINEVTARHAAKIAYELDADAVVTFTETGFTARAISKFRIKQPIFVISQQKHVLRQTNLVFGAFALSHRPLEDKESLIEIARKELLKARVVKKGSKVVIAAGTIFGKPGGTNTIITITL